METDMMTMMMETTTPCGLPVSPALLVGRRRHARVESEARVHAARLRGSGGSWFGASVFLPTEYPMSASPGNRPMRAAFVQAQNKFVAELEEGGGKKVVVSKLETDDEIEAFVQQAYNDVTQRRNKCKAQELRKILQQSRDAVLQSSTPRAAKRFCRMPSNTSPSPMSSSQMVCHASCCDSEIEGADAKGEDGSVAGSPKSSVVNVGDGGPSAATSTNSTVAEVTVDTASNPPAEEFSVRMRGVNKNKLWKVTLPSALFLEGTHEPRPSSSATIFLKTHYATEDEQTLKYVPYFGDDDKDDVVSDLYNLEDREKQMEFGPEYQERDTNDVIDETLILVQKRLADSGLDGKTDITTGAIPKRNTLQNRINDVLADIMDEYRSRVHERFEMVCRHGGKKSSAASPKKCTTKKLHSYLDAMDTYRPLFCRRCFVYDCNMHGNLNKPSLELQGELAVQKEREGFWSEEAGEDGENGNDTPNAGQTMKCIVASPAVQGTPPETTNNQDAVVGTDSGQVDDDAVARCQESHTQGGRGQKRRRSDPSSEVVDKDSQDSLTRLQEVILERVFLIFQGDTGKVAEAIGAPHQLVKDYVDSSGVDLKPFKHLKDEQIHVLRKKGKRGSKSIEQSMSNYNVAWLKRVEDAEIHPFFVPCDHDGICSEATCSCIQNAFFCTKHCVWGKRSRNFFRGCACSGKCTTKSCPCFAAKRECDPDLCRSCGACTDPPNKPATTQRCRNDSIGMRRHCHLLLGKSTIADAGWGIFTRYALKKGDFVHEYVGEVISQEEAERRGRIYDKVNRSYLFNLSSDYVVDASRKGNKSRFANHSSKPNCYTKMVNVNGDIRIGLFAKDDIDPQSELFFDYRYDVGMDNDLIVKPGMMVDWMKNPKMANKISKKMA